MKKLYLSPSMRCMLIKAGLNKGWAPIQLRDWFELEDKLTGVVAGPEGLPGQPCVLIKNRTENGARVEVNDDYDENPVLLLHLENEQAKLLKSLWEETKFAALPRDMMEYLIDSFEQLDNQKRSKEKPEWPHGVVDTPEELLLDTPVDTEDTDETA